MYHTTFVAVLFLLAIPVVKANQCLHDGECPSRARARLQNGVSLLQTKLQKNVIEDSYGRRYAMLERQAQHVEKEGVAVVIPGLGSEIRALQVERNLQWLKNQNIPFDCWIFVYRTEVEFPLDASRFEPCHVSRHPGFWMGHVLAMPLNMTNKPWIIHMMDGIEPQQDVNLKLLIRTMVANGLGFASPTFDTNGQMNHSVRYPIMARHKDNQVGRFVDFIELHFDVFSREYFACLQDNIDIDNTLGWGMDFLLPQLCGGAPGGSEVQAGRVGLMDQMTMVKKMQGAYPTAEAYRGMAIFMRRHPEMHRPNFTVLGELEAPEAL